LPVLPASGSGALACCGRRLKTAKITDAAQ
jgi:hypothetical protein